MSVHSQHVRDGVENEDDASAVTASWRRCLNVHRLDPDRSGPRQPDPAALREAQAREYALRKVVEPCLDRLYALLSNSDCAILVTDHTGLALDLRTNRRQDEWGRPPDEWVGTCYAESRVGTNGIGTCLAEERDLVVRGEEHFLTRLTSCVGISAPVFGPDGSLVGCLHINQNVDAHDARLDRFLSISLANFARRIETEMFALAHPATRLVLASPGGTKPDALLAIDDDDRVVGATRGARRLLALGDEAIASGPSVTELYATTERHNEVLADVERRAIVRTLARCGGNLSSAARTIGISRSTLYRKLKSYDDAPQPMAPMRPNQVRPRPLA